jgi:hypothetical protein
MSAGIGNMAQNAKMRAAAKINGINQLSAGEYDMWDTGEDLIAADWRLNVRFRIMWAIFLLRRAPIPCRAR